MNRRHPYPFVPARQQGLSLVELMIALVVGLVFMAGVISMFLASRQSYTLGSAVARLQENGRFALDFMRPVLRIAGYTGCGNQSMWQQPSVNLLNTRTDILNFTQAIQGYDYNNPATNVGGSYAIASETPALDTSANDWSPALPTTIWNAISTTVIPGSDIIMIHAVNPGGIDISSFPGGGQSANVKVYNNVLLAKAGLVIGTIAYVTNCSQSAVFQATNVNQSSGTVDHSTTGNVTPGNYSAGKVGNFGLPAQLYTIQTYVYYIGRGVDQGPALYQVMLNNTGSLATPQELVPDIANMQILYGVDTDGDGIANQYVAASDIANWAAANIVSVRLALLIRSNNNVVPAAAPTALDVDGVAVTPPPNPGAATTRRLHRVFVETITLRNHVP
ncbi:MAG TPA: PilW family protein [Gammaproteobacteria bacterium]|nr:PilW family protein [Gammaproteobacteria bacterium]